ncbi:hypothetical protein VNI00_019063 [Paramarasmius palmivorus]|uniref:HMG domain-containing protein n=1 Tax=Paramarasmius palmivorus TaxID=297713 RepID=A0AAW0AQY2_9AGAR
MFVRPIGKAKLDISVPLSEAEPTPPHVPNPRTSGRARLDSTQQGPRKPSQKPPRRRNKPNFNLNDDHVFTLPSGRDSSSQATGLNSERKDNDDSMTGTFDGLMACSLVDDDEPESTDSHVLYWNALKAAGVLFRLNDEEFVMQDWDAKHRSLQIGSYHHIVRQPTGPGAWSVSCTCSAWKAHKICLHHHVFITNLSDVLDLVYIAPTPTPRAVLLHVTPFQIKYIFSCISSTGRYESGKRTIVALCQDGRWHCQSCRFADTCKHRRHAEAYAVDAKLIQPELASSQNDINASGVERVAEDEQAVQEDSVRRNGVSYITIPPPRWCALPHEAAYTAPKPMLPNSLFFPFSATSSRCSCGCTFGDQQPLWVAHNIVPIIQPATLFDKDRCVQASVQVIACPDCKHARRQVGPDLGEYGVFNWNNEMLFSHDLLNSFTSQSTSSETPFSAFCLTIRRAYMSHSVDMKFCSDETFIKVWIAFTRLQALNSGMACPTCGDSPEIVIADGISLSTHASKLTEHVQPPSHTNSNSEVITTISSYKAQAIVTIPKKDLRDVVKTILDLTADEYDTDTLELPATKQLEAEHEELYFFIQIYIFNGSRSSYYKSYRILLEQICAPDVVLQLVQHAALQGLNDIFSDGYTSDWFQSVFPAFGAIIEVHRRENTPLPPALRLLARWLMIRAETVYNKLAQHDPAPPRLIIESPDQSWDQTGTCYGRPAVRTRCTYPGIKKDGSVLDKQDKGSDGSGDCNKFYKTYSKNKLTGGIMVLWCRHSICLGFHTIPSAEGRNDVFSAIYTRFVKAPKVIVYDFACQLATYCLVREARFFRETLFLIDEFHAHDHTRCGQAFFASNWMRYNDMVRQINTSAAECGNKGMKRIRKIVAYMNYENALVFTKAFLDVWNREVIMRMMRT